MDNKTDCFDEIDYCCLIDAIRTSDEEYILNLFSKYKNVIPKPRERLNEDQKSTQLYRAVTEGDRQKVKLLLKKGALKSHLSLNRDKPFMYPVCTHLHLAVQYKDLAIIRLLIENGANLEVKDSEGRTPFDIAIYDACNRKDWTLVNGIVSILLSKPSVLNSIVSNSGALLHVVVKHNLSGLDRLLNKRPDICIQNQQGQTPLHVAYYNYKKLTDYPYDNYVDCEYFIELLRYYDKFVLEKGRTSKVWQQNPKDNNGLTHFHIICEQSYDYENLKRMFLNNGADVTAKYGKCELTPLHFAAYSGNVDLVEDILKNLKSFENVVDGYGVSFFHIACNTDLPGIVKKFLQRRGDQVNVNSRVKKNAPRIFARLAPLHIAVRNSNVEVIEELLKHPNINVNIESYGYELEQNYFDDLNLTPLELVPMFKQSTKFNNSLGKMIYPQYLTIVDMLVSRGADAFRKMYKYERSILEVACEGGFNRCVKIILNHIHHLHYETTNFTIKYCLLSSIAIAIQKENDKLLTILVENGGLVFKNENCYEISLLECAAEKGIIGYFKIADVAKKIYVHYGPTYAHNMDVRVGRLKGLHVNVFCRIDYLNLVNAAIKIAVHNKHSQSVKKLSKYLHGTRILQKKSYSFDDIFLLLVKFIVIIVFMLIFVQWRAANPSF